MKVVISVSGRFHAFDLAGELEKLGVLHRLITTYPRFKAAEWGIPRGKIVSVLSSELANRLVQRLPGALLEPLRLRYFLSERFDKAAASAIPPDTDVFVGFAGYCLHQLRAAKRAGAFTIVERGSAHILEQIDILTREYAQLGKPLRGFDMGIVEKQLEEYEEADAISIPSRFVQTSFEARGFDREKLFLNPYGVNTEDFSPGPRRDEIFRVLHCGAVSVQKGVPYLLEAFKQVPGEAELLLVGGVGEEMKPILAGWPDQRVRVKGRVPQKMLPEIYRTADVFCLASLQDGFAMVFLQAMSAGLAVIGTERGGAPDILTDGKDGFIVPAESSIELAERLNFLRNNPDKRRSMGRSAAETIRSGFTWRDYGKRAAVFYQRQVDSSA